MNDAIKMQLSAFVDGELSEAEAGLFIRRLSRDPELRALVADYQVVGRVMRAEESVTGIDQLLQRINVELGAETGLSAEPSAATPVSKRRFKPMLGAAAAVAVAVLAVFGLGQFESAPDTLSAESYTVPEAGDEIYFERHGQTSGSLSTRVVTYQLQSENLDADSEPQDTADSIKDPDETSVAE